MNDIAAFLICRLFVPLIYGHIHGLAISETIHEEYHRLLFQFFFLINRCFRIFNHGHSRNCILFFQFFQFFDDNFRHRSPASQHILVKCDVFQRLLMFFHKSFHFQTNQLVQTHLKNSCCLPFCKMKFRRLFFRSAGLECDPFRLSGYQTCFRLFDIFASPEDLDDQVDHITGADQAFLHFFFLQCFFQQCLIFSGSQLILKIHIVPNHIHKSHGLRPSIGYCQHIHAKRIFQTGLFVQKIQEIFRICTFFQFNDDADAFFG